MDFRSQLSAFASRGGRGGRGGDRGGRGGDRGSDRGGDRGSDRGGDRGSDRGDRGDRGGDRGSGRGGDRGGGRGGDRGGGRGGDRGGDRGGGRGGDRGGRGRGGNSPNQRGYNNRYNNNSNNNNSSGNYYSRGGSDHQNRGGSDHQSRGGSDHQNQGDKRRQRPENWNHQQGPPTQKRRHNSPDRDGLGSLRSFGYRIPRGFPPPPTPEAKAKKTKHIALLVITIDDLPYEHLWKAWCQTLNPSNRKDDYFISVVCHAKFPLKVKSEWLRQRMLVHAPKVGRGNSYLDPDFLTRSPNWGSVEITRAMLDLLHAAMKIGHCKQKDMRFSANRFLARRPLVPLDSEEEPDETIPPVDQFLYISETCIPVVSAQEMFDLVKDTTVSWVNARHRRDPDTPKNAYENDQFALINRRVPGQYRWKADQWVLLCRHQAQQMLNIDRPHIPPKHQLWQSFREINASDEMYIPTCLAMLGWLRFASDGEDTQKSRGNNQSEDNRPRSNSNTTDDKGRDSNNHNTNDKDKKATPGTDKTDTESGEKSASNNDSKSFPTVLKRPVTYTDWSEGMRNPATFVKGISDFKLVSRLARKKGCLVARKFAPYIAVPGIPDEEQKVTGQISVEEWKKEIEKLSVEFKVEATSDTEEEGANNVAPDKSDNEGDDNSSSGEEEEQEESFINAGRAANDEDDDDDEEEEEEEADDEDEENQL